MAIRRPKHASLERVLGTSALFSTAYGNVGSSIYYALGVVAVFALGLTPITFLIAGVIFAMTAATYAEATVMYPEAGGSSSFARHAFNEVVSFIAAWGQMLNYIVTVAISAFFVPHYLHIFWDPLLHGPADVIGGALLIALLVCINIIGTRESARLNIVLAITDLMTQIALVVIGVFLVLNPDTLISNVKLGVAPTWGNFALGIAVGMIAYTGIETISNMAEEAKDAAKTIPSSVRLVTLAVLGLYIMLPVIALSAMPVGLEDGRYVTELSTTYKDDPILGIVNNLHLGPLLTDILRIYVGVLAAIILVIATNAGLIGVSRLTYSMGHHRQVPQILRKVHSRFKTPYIALFVFGAVAMLTLLPGETDFLAKMYSFGAMLSFTIAHVSLISLRIRHPDAKREWRAPMNLKVRGRSIPLTAVLGGLGTFSAWVVVMALDFNTLIVGTAWMLLGLLLYVAYRRRSQIPLAVTAKIVVPKPIVEHEVEYNSILIVFDDLSYSRQAVQTAVRMAARKRRGVHVLVTMSVPMHLPANASLKVQEERAEAILEDARFVGGRRVTGEWAKVRPGEAGRRIVAEAQEMKAEAIVMPLPKRRGAPLFTRTIETLLKRRPCRIIIDSAPEGAVTKGPIATTAVRT